MLRVSPQGHVFIMSISAKYESNDNADSDHRGAGTLVSFASGTSVKQSEGSEQTAKQLFSHKLSTRRSSFRMSKCYERMC